MEEQHDLVNGRKLGQRHGVVPRCREDTVDTDRPWLVAEQRGHDERVGETDFDTVHETVTRALEDGQRVVVRRAGDKC